MVAIIQPIGHASQMPVDANGIDKALARTTRRIRSVKVAIINLVLSIIVDTISLKIYKPANIYYSTYSLR